MNDLSAAVLIACLFGPPALFGITVLIEDVLDRRHWRRLGAELAAEQRADAVDRHPSAWDGQ